MRHRLWMIIVAGLAARAAVACAADGTAPPAPVLDGAPPDSSSLVTPPTADGSDAGDASDGSPLDAGIDADVEWCSDAGWCTTRVPDPSIRFFALVPLEQRAFALAWIDGRTTPLVFDGNRWDVIADEAWAGYAKDEQLLYALAAPSEHDIWLGGARGFLVHGVETSGSWSFTKMDLLTSETVRSLFAVDAAELFVATDTRVYHRGGDSADAGEWSLEYESPDIEAEVELVNATSIPVPVRFSAIIGKSASDVWLFGQRVRCGHIARRTSAGWSTVSDSLGVRAAPETPDTQVGCLTRSPYVDSIPLTLPSMTASGAFVALSGTAVLEGRLLPTRFSLLGRGYLPDLTDRLWQAPDSPARYAVGYATVMSNPDMQDGGTWTYSTISADGKTPTLKKFTTIGGTSEKNMWVAGESYALHRTLP